MIVEYMEGRTTWPELQATWEEVSAFTAIRRIKTTWLTASVLVVEIEPQWPTLCVPCPVGPEPVSGSQPSLDSPGATILELPQERRRLIYQGKPHELRDVEAFWLLRDLRLRRLDRGWGP